MLKFVQTLLVKSKLKNFVCSALHIVKGKIKLTPSSGVINRLTESYKPFFVVHSETRTV